jgi:hypothetical protein
VLLTFFGFSFATQSGGQKASPIPADQQALDFVYNRKVLALKMVKETKKNLIKSLIGDIDSQCGKFKPDVDIMTSGHCTIRDSNGNLVTFKVFKSGNYYIFTKKVQKPFTIKTSQVYLKLQTTPNVPSQSSVGLGRWFKIFSGIVYVVLTVYLFIVAASNLLKREFLFLLLDLLLWAILTAAMYTVMGGF